MGSLERDILDVRRQKKQQSNNELVNQQQLQQQQQQQPRQIVPKTSIPSQRNAQMGSFVGTYKKRPLIPNQLANDVNEDKNHDERSVCSSSDEIKPQQNKLRSFGSNKTNSRNQFRRSNTSLISVASSDNQQQQENSQHSNSSSTASSNTTKQNVIGQQNKKPGGPVVQRLAPLRSTSLINKLMLNNSNNFSQTKPDASIPKMVNNNKCDRKTTELSKSISSTKLHQRPTTDGHTGQKQNAGHSNINCSDQNSFTSNDSTNYNQPGAQMRLMAPSSKRFENRQQKALNRSLSYKRSHTITPDQRNKQLAPCQTATRNTAGNIRLHNSAHEKNTATSNQTSSFCRYNHSLISRPNHTTKSSHSSILSIESQNDTDNDLMTDEYSLMDDETIFADDTDNAARSSEDENTHCMENGSTLNIEDIGNEENFRNDYNQEEVEGHFNTDTMNNFQNSPTPRQVMSPRQSRPLPRLKKYTGGDLPRRTKSDKRIISLAHANNGSGLNLDDNSCASSNYSSCNRCKNIIHRHQEEELQQQLTNSTFDSGCLSDCYCMHDCQSISDDRRDYDDDIIRCANSNSIYRAWSNDDDNQAAHSITGVSSHHQHLNKSKRLSVFSERKQSPSLISCKSFGSLSDNHRFYNVNEDKHCNNRQRLSNNSSIRNEEDYAVPTSLQMIYSHDSGPASCSSQQSRRSSSTRPHSRIIFDPTNSMFHILPPHGNQHNNDDKNDGANEKKSFNDDNKVLNNSSQNKVLESMRDTPDAERETRVSKAKEDGNNKKESGLNLEKRMRNSLSSLIDNFTNQTSQNQQVVNQPTRDRKSLPLIEKTSSQTATNNKTGPTKMMYPQVKDDDLLKQDIMKSKDNNISMSKQTKIYDDKTIMNSASSDGGSLIGLKKVKSSTLKEPLKGPIATVSSNASNWQRSSGLTFKSLFGLSLGKQQNQQRKLSASSQNQTDPTDINSSRTDLVDEQGNSKPTVKTSNLSFSQSSSNLSGLPKVPVRNNVTTTNAAKKTTNSASGAETRGNQSLETEGMTLSTKRTAITSHHNSNNINNNNKTRIDSNDITAKNIIISGSNIDGSIKKGSPASSSLSSPTSSSSTSSLNIIHDNDQGNGSSSRSDKLHNRRIFSQEGNKEYNRTEENTTQSEKIEVHNLSSELDADTTLVSNILDSSHEKKDCQKLANKITELELKLQSKEKSFTNLQLEQLSAAYLVDQLRSTIEKLEQENSHLKATLNRYHQIQPGHAGFNGPLKINQG